MIDIGKNGIWSYAKTGAKLGAIGLVSGLLWFLVSLLAVALGIVTASPNASVILVLLWLPMAVVVNGYLARRFWKWI